MRKQMIEYLPPILRRVYEFQLLSEAEQAEVDRYDTATKAVLNNQFIADAEESGIERYESILGILPKATETLEERRFRVLSIINEQLPFTMARLHQHLATLCGEGGYSLLLDAGAYTLSVLVELVSKNNYTDVLKLLGRVLPANLIVEYATQPAGIASTFSGAMPVGMELEITAEVKIYGMG